MARMYRRTVVLYVLAAAALISGSPQAPVDPQQPQAASASNGQNSHAVDAIAFMVITLVIGVFTSHLLAPALHLPYTALLMVRHAFMHACLHHVAHSPCQASSINLWWLPGVGCHPRCWKRVLFSGLGSHQQWHKAVGGELPFPFWAMLHLFQVSSGFDELQSLFPRASPPACAQSIDPTLLLTAFLPILLFAAAFALEWHTVRRLIWSSLLLAGIHPCCTSPTLNVEQSTHASPQHPQSGRGAWVGQRGGAHACSDLYLTSRHQGCLLSVKVQSTAKMSARMWLQARAC